MGTSQHHLTSLLLNSLPRWKSWCVSFILLFVLLFNKGVNQISKHPNMCQVILDPRSICWLKTLTTCGQRSGSGKVLILLIQLKYILTNILLTYIFLTYLLTYFFTLYLLTYFLPPYLLTYLLT